MRKCTLHRSTEFVFVCDSLGLDTGFTFFNPLCLSSHSKLKHLSWEFESYSDVWSTISIILLEDV